MKISSIVDDPRTFKELFFKGELKTIVVRIHSFVCSFLALHQLHVLSHVVARLPENWALKLAPRVVLMNNWQNLLSSSSREQVKSLIVASVLAEETARLRLGEICDQQGVCFVGKWMLELNSLIPTPADLVQVHIDRSKRLLSSTSDRFQHQIEIEKNLIHLIPPSLSLQNQVLINQAIQAIQVQDKKTLTEHLKRQLTDPAHFIETSTLIDQIKEVLSGLEEKEDKETIFLGALPWIQLKTLPEHQKRIVQFFSSIPTSQRLKIRDQLVLYIGNRNESFLTNTLDTIQDHFPKLFGLSEKSGRLDWDLEDQAVCLGYLLQLVSPSTECYKFTDLIKDIAHIFLDHRGDERELALEIGEEFRKMRVEYSLCQKMINGLLELKRREGVLSMREVLSQIFQLLNTEKNARFWIPRLESIHTCLLKSVISFLNQKLCILIRASDSLSRETCIEETVWSHLTRMIQTENSLRLASRLIDSQINPTCILRVLDFVAQIKEEDRIWLLQNKTSRPVFKIDQIFTSELNFAPSLSLLIIKRIVEMNAQGCFLDVQYPHVILSQMLPSLNWLSNNPSPEFVPFIGRLEVEFFRVLERIVRGKSPTSKNEILNQLLILVQILETHPLLVGSYHVHSLMMQVCNKIETNPEPLRTFVDKIRLQVSPQKNSSALRIEYANCLKQSF